MKEYYIGADLGTTNIKVCAYDCEGRELASASSRHETFYSEGGAEQDPLQWWEGFVTAVAKIVKSMGAGKCRTLCISSHVPSLLAIDKDGVAICRAMIWKDYRASTEAQTLHDKYGAKLYQNNPAKVLPYHFISKLAWFIRNRPEEYDRTWKFIQAKDYLNLRLTGKVLLDESQCGLNHLFDLRKRCIDSALAEELSDSLLEKFPKIVTADTCIGTLLPEVAEQIGLHQDVQVFAGGVDSGAAILGCGIYKEGELALSLGTGANVVLCHSLDAEQEFLHDLSLVRCSMGDTYLSMCTTSNAGSILDWYLDHMDLQYRQRESRGEGSRYDLLFDQAKTSPPGCNGIVFLPYLEGETAPVFDATAKGVFFGIQSTTECADMGRAVLESLCYSLRDTTEYLAKKCGILGISKVNVSGGPTQQPLWMQMLADVLQTPVEVCKNITSAPRGNALVGILAMNPELTMESFSCETEYYEPNASLASVYDRNYNVYRQIYTQLKDLYKI